MKFSLFASLALASALISTAVGSHAALASGLCADPANNCPNNGQVTYSHGTDAGGSPTGSTNSGSSQSSTRIWVTPASAPIGASVTVSGQGFAPGGHAGAVFLNLVTSDRSQVEMRNNGDPIVQAGRDGSFSAQVTVPAKAQTGSQQICANSMVAPTACTPFTVSGGQPANPTDQNQQSSSSIYGHYQCSSYVLIGFGGDWCNGTEPQMVLNPDGTYQFGDNSGSFSFDGQNISFDDGSVSGYIQNRKLVFEVPTDTGVARFTYIRMDY